MAKYYVKKEVTEHISGMKMCTSPHDDIVGGNANALVISGNASFMVSKYIDPDTHDVHLYISSYDSGAAITNDSFFANQIIAVDSTNNSDSVKIEQANVVLHFDETSPDDASYWIGNSSGAIWLLIFI